MSNMNQNTPVITKETKNRIFVDYEGKLTFKDRMKQKLKSSNTWIKVVVNIFRFILMLGVSFVILYPFFSRIASSFMTYEDILAADVALIPKHFTLDTYKYLIVDNRYFEAFLHTLLISLSSALLQMLITCLIGYGLAKFKFRGNKAVMIAVIVSMIIPHSVLSIAMERYFIKFDLLKFFAFPDEMGETLPGLIELITFGAVKPIQLTNSIWPFVMLSATGFAFKNGLYIYMMRQFFRGVPDELEESAYVDGANTVRTFFQIILPISVPMLITIFLFAFSWQWTDQFYTDMFYKSGAGLKDKELWVLMKDIYKVVPATYRDIYSAKPGYDLFKIAIENTAGIMIIFPLIIIYLFCQRYLVAGIERSGIVG